MEQDGDTKAFYKCGESTDLGGGERGIRSMCTLDSCETKILSKTMHNVHFGYYVYLPTEQAETYLKSCVLINYSTYICLCLFGWKVNMILKETVTFKL